MTHLYHCHTRSHSHSAHTFIAHTAHTYMCFHNTPTRTHTLAHGAAQRWVFLNTVLFGSLLYNMCLRDSQSYSDLFSVSVGRWEETGLTSRHDSLLSFQRERKTKIKSYHLCHWASLLNYTDEIREQA